MSDTLECGHPQACLEVEMVVPDMGLDCPWCNQISMYKHTSEICRRVRNLLERTLVARDETIDDLRRDNENLTAQLTKQALILSPGKHDFGNVTLGYVQMLPGSSIGGPYEALTVETKPPPKAKSETKHE